MNNIETYFSELYGQYCWDVDWEGQLNLSMHFGEPRLSVRQPISRNPGKRYVRAKGRWWLWVWLAYWKVSFPDGFAITSASTTDRRARGLFRLEGQALTEVRVHEATGRTRLTFDLGAVLDIRRMSRKEAEDLWFLYRPRKYVLAVRGDGFYNHRRANKEETRWNRIVDT